MTDGPERSGLPRWTVLGGIGGVVAAVLSLAVSLAARSGSQVSYLPATGQPTSQVEPSAAPTVTPAPPRPSGPVNAADLTLVVFDLPQPRTVVQPGADVRLAGRVSGLHGRTLWLISRPQESDSYFLAASGPVTAHDGDWSSVDQEVGDLTDRGSQIVYFAVLADPACAGGLGAARRDTGGENRLMRLPPDCEVVASRSVQIAP